MLDAGCPILDENREFSCHIVFSRYHQDSGPDIIGIIPIHRDYGQVAQSVEQRTENPCVGGSIPPLPIHKFLFGSNLQFPLFQLCPYERPLHQFLTQPLGRRDSGTIFQIVSPIYSSHRIAI
jgi:hypothetical protein